MSICQEGIEGDCVQQYINAILVKKNVRRTALRSDGPQGMYSSANLELRLAPGRVIFI